MKPSRPSAGASGFTLMEILVALTLVGLLVAALVPTVISQLGKGEVNRVVEDTGVINSAVKAFRVDVGRYPGDLEDLVVAPTAADADINEVAYPTSLLSKWAGPYLERGGLGATSTISTGMGGSIQNAFSKTTWGGKSFLTVNVEGVSQSDAQSVSTAVDGDNAVGAAAETAGQVRWLGNNSANPDTLLYLATPVN